ncbi:MAG: WYL domain-containing transcriptional regulator [Verrucomicrobiota bacterium]
MLRIHQAIQGGNRPNASTLARELEVSTKSIHRDIEFMRDRLELPVEYDPARFGYFYAGEVNAFPTLQITEGELFALLVAEKALQQYRGTSFERPLLSAIRKMEQSLPDTISLNLAELEQSISFRTRAEPVLDLQVFDTLAKATSRRHQIEFDYRKPGSPKPESRTVDPYHLANINGEWYLFGFDHWRQDLRTFNPARIRNVRLTGKSFEKPGNFSLEDRLRHSFGVYSGKNRHKVVIRFSPRAADYIREKKWHGSQKLKDLPGGAVELQLELSSLSEVRRWILSWEGEAVPIAPPELVDSYRETARRILRSEANGLPGVPRPAGARKH